MRDPQLLERLDGPPQILGPLGRVGPRRPQDGPTLEVDSRDVRDRERAHPVRSPLNEVLEPVV